MPQSIRFPSGFDTDTSLFLAVNNKRTRLTSNITDTTTTIPVITTSGFPSTGFVTILTGTDVTKAEAIAYSGTGSTTFLNAERGADGTVALPHNANDNVDLTIVSRHHNNMKDAVIQLEQFVGVSGNENFLRVDDSGNVTISGNFDFKMSGAISGTVTVGEIPTMAAPNVPFDLEDGTFTTSSTAYVDITDSVTAPLPVGHNLLIYGATAGTSAGTTPSVNLKCVFAGVDAGENSDRSFATSGTYGGINLSGFKIVTGDGVNTAKLQADLDTAASVLNVSARALLSVPLAALGLIENSDYWFSNGLETDTVVSSATFANITTVNATLPETGDYLVFGSAEMRSNSASPFQVRYALDGTVLSSTAQRATLITADYRSMSFARLISVTAGTHSFTVQAARTAGTPNIRRARICIIRAGAFDKVTGLRSTSTQNTSSTVFTKVTSSEITHIPNQPESVIFIANPDATTSTVTGPPTMNYKLVNETDVVDYMTDTTPTVFRATADVIPTFLFTKLDNVSVPKTFSLSFREGQFTGSTVTHNAVNMITWSLTSATAGGDVQFTTINEDGVVAYGITAVTGTFSDGITVGDSTSRIFPEQIETPTLITENLTVTGPTGIVTASGSFSKSLTVSGLPVSTSAGVTDHGLLTGLADDDHPQYGSTAQNETITGAWNFTTSLSISGVPVATGAGVIDHGALTGLLDDDHPQYGALAQNETVTGAWNFSNSLAVSGVPLITGSFTVRETDGSPSIYGVHTLVVTTGSLTDLGGGVVRVVTGAGGGGGGGVSEHGDLGGLGNDDHPQYGHLSQNETVGGTWNFSNGLSVSGTSVQTKRMVQRVQIFSSTQTAADNQWLNMPAALTLFQGLAKHVQLLDTRDFTQVRLLINKGGVTAGVAGSAARLRYHTAFTTTAATYIDIGTTGSPQVSIDTTDALLDSGWHILLPGAKIENLYLALVGSGGNGAVDPDFGAIVAEFR